jgi:tRNA(Ile)-lysidine synthase
MSILNTLKEKLSCEPLELATHLVVAYSGGVDSHVLLHALSTIKKEALFDFQLSATHIHHGLSHNADQWQNHCEQVCNDLGIPFQTANVKVQTKPRHSIEALARDARYHKLTELAPNGSYVLLAQHQDDQLETFLLQLKRGAGPKGLSGMNNFWVAKDAVQADKSVNYYRPMLDISRAMIMEYAKVNQLNWCEDESNQNTDFDRNFLRHQVLPNLQSRWPAIAKSVSRSAQLCAQQQSLLDEVCEVKLKGIKNPNNSLSIVKLSQLSEAWLYQVVRYWLTDLGLPSPSMAVLQLLQSDVINAKQDATPILQWQGWEFRRFDQQLYVIATAEPKSPYEKQWQGEQHIQLPNNFGKLKFKPVSSATQNSARTIIVDPTLGQITIRNGGYSAKFKPTGGYPTKPIKQWFKQWKIAPWLRDSILLIVQNERVVAVLINGHWQHSEYRPAATKNDLISISFQT